MSPPASLPTPLVDGRYAPLEELGRGAVATTFRARDASTGAIVALKRLHPELRSEPAVVERFRREVELVRRIRHPHVLELHELVEDGDDLWLVMEFRAGGDLADRLAAHGPLRIEDVVALGVQMAGALAAAHAAGIVHRDVKPANVLFGVGPQPDARLCDFGLARSADASRLTSADAVVGTPAAMAPETITDGHADPRSDLYSLGVLLFQAATGELPFRGETPYELMRQHLHERAPALRSLRTDAPVWLDALVARTLEKDPLDRPATADELQRWLAAGEGNDAEARAIAPVPGETAVCGRCGGWIITAVDVCADCGQRTTLLESRKGGVAVVVTGGKVGSRLPLHDHAALYRVLNEVAPAWLPPRGKRRAPRLPAVVATDLTEASAKDLVERLRAVGLQAGVRERYRTETDVRAKRRYLLSRYFAVWAGTMAFGPHLVRFGHGVELLALVPMVSCLALTGGLAQKATFSPLLRAPRRGSTIPAIQRVGAAIATLSARHDRRLLGRLVERLSHAARVVGEDVTAPMLQHLADWSVALVAVDAASAAQPGRQSGAQEMNVVFLRDAERRRMALRQRLLEVAGRLDGLLARATLAGVRAADERAQPVRAALTELSLQIDARREVAAVLKADS